jgi:hypothetical protein
MELVSQDLFNKINGCFIPLDEYNEQAPVCSKGKKGWNLIMTTSILFTLCRYIQILPTPAISTMNWQGSW